MRVHRVDVGTRIRADHRTPQGHARIPARFSRTGVQDYVQADGTVRREYRPPEEVFSKQSLDSFETATVVVGHPAMITPENWKEHAAGDIRAPKRDGIYTAGDIVLRDKSALDDVDAGKLQEISCGYDCMLEMTPGVSPEGEKYDAIQRDIVINHIGLGPKDWGRAGNEVRLRLDGGGIAYLREDEAGHRPAGMTVEEQLKALQAKHDTLVTEAEAAKKRADSAEGKLKATADADLAKVESARDALADELKKLKAQPSINVDERIDTRIAILEGAARLHGKRVDNKGTDREIMIAAVHARNPDVKFDGRSEDYVRARFDGYVEAVTVANDSLEQVNRGTAPPALAPGARNDGADAEMAELVKNFDAAPDFLENYHRAEPWLHGETSAMNAARKSVGG